MTKCPEEKLEGKGGGKHGAGAADLCLPHQPHPPEGIERESSSAWLSLESQAYMLSK